MKPLANAKAVCLALLSALLLVLSFPTFDFHFLAWIGLVPLFIALRDKSPMWGFALSFLTGMTFLMGIFYWINIVNGFKWTNFLVLGIYFGSYFGLVGLGVNFVRQKGNISLALAAPVLWVSMEYARSHAGFLGLPWALLGHSQYLNLPLIQIASITGVYGISFLIVLVNVALSEFLGNLPGSLKLTLVTISVLGLSVLYGVDVISKPPSTPKMRVSVIQGNIPQEIKWEPQWREHNMAKHIKLTKDAVHGGHASLVVWPETSVPGNLTQDFNLLHALGDLANASRADLVVGSSVRPKFGSRQFRMEHRFNSAFLISPERAVVSEYKKIRLLPFSEYLPYRGSFPWTERLTSASGNFLAGKEHTLFAASGVKFGVVICWESIFADFFRNFVKKGAQFMVNITNEARFEETAAPYQFLAMNVFRAVENRRSIARSANTGISGFIDPYGRIIGVIKDAFGKEIFVEGHLTKEIPLSKELTLYTLYGDIFAYGNLVALVLVIVVSIGRGYSVGRGKTNSF